MTTTLSIANSKQWIAYLKIGTEPALLLSASPHCSSSACTDVPVSPFTPDRHAYAAPTAVPLTPHHAAHLILSLSLILLCMSDLPPSRSGEGHQHVSSLSSTATRKLTAWASSGTPVCTQGWQAMVVTQFTKWVKSTFSISHGAKLPAGCSNKHLKKFYLWLKSLFILTASKATSSAVLLYTHATED